MWCAPTAGACIPCWWKSRKPNDSFTHSVSNISEKEMNRMRFTRVSHVHSQSHDRWACQVGSRTRQGAILPGANSSVRANA
jgi:hypothetical protein